MLMPACLSPVAFLGLVMRLQSVKGASPQKRFPETPFFDPADENSLMNESSSRKALSANGKLRLSLPASGKLANAKNHCEKKCSNVVLDTLIFMLKLCYIVNQELL
jgi:hypothetical protein